MEDTANRRRTSDIHRWVSEASSLNSEKLGSTVKIDDKTYLPLSKVDEDEDCRNNSKKDETPVSDLSLSIVKSNGVRLVPFGFNSV